MFYGLIDTSRTTACQANRVAVAESPSMTPKNGRLTRMHSTSPLLAGMVSRSCVMGDTPSPASDGTNTNVRKVTSSSPTAKIAA